MWHTLHQAAAMHLMDRLEPVILEAELGGIVSCSSIREYWCRNTIVQLGRV